MKHFLPLLLLSLPVTSYAQSQADYERVEARFMVYYNRVEAEKICKLYEDKGGTYRSSLWTKEQLEDLHKEYGNMRSYKFLELYWDGTGDGGGDGLALFKVVFAKSTHIMAITLNKQNELITSRFRTSSPHIDSLLAKSQ